MSELLVYPCWVSIIISYSSYLIFQGVLGVRCVLCAVCLVSMSLGVRHDTMTHVVNRLSRLSTLDSRRGHVELVEASYTCSTVLHLR